MRLALAVAVAAAAPLVAARTDDSFHARHVQHARQVLAASPSSSVTTSATNGPAAGAPSPVSSGAAVPPAVTSASVPLSAPPVPPATVSISISLLSTNPTAVPLASINGNASSAPTQALASTPAPGTQPTFIPNAPPLPNIATLNPANYPPLDKVPPTDSPQVLQWIQEVQATGVQIPSFNATVAGGCPANLEAVQDPNRCWWTCGGCTRNTDITECPEPRTWGLTYDDGPGFYTPQLLAYLEQVNLKATFFIVGSRALEFSSTLQAEYMGQHQIAVHTWSHPSLTTLTNEQIIAELGWSKFIIEQVLGVTPNMMRPPFGDIDDRVRAISMAMGLVPVMWTRISPTQTFDTDDFDIHSGMTTVEQVLSNWEGIMNNVTSRDTGFIVLEHDLFQQTVEVATGYILPDAIARKLTIEPVYACLKKPIADAYIETNDNNTNPPPAGFGAVDAPSPPTTPTNPRGSGTNSSSSTGGTSPSQGSGAIEKLQFGTAILTTSLAMVLSGLFATL